MRRVAFQDVFVISDPLNRQRPSHTTVASVGYLTQVNDGAGQYSQYSRDFTINGFVVEPDVLSIVVEVTQGVFHRQKDSVPAREAVDGRKRLGGPDGWQFGSDRENLAGVDSTAPNPWGVCKERVRPTIGSPSNSSQVMKGIGTGHIPGTGQNSFRIQ